MKTEDFAYDLPAEFIAQTPAEPRDHSRLMVIERETGGINHHHFFEIGQFLRAGDLLVVNETRVFPARFYGHKLPGGGKVELLLLKKLDDLSWECLVGGSGMKPGRQIQVTEGPLAEVLEDLGESRRLMRFVEPIEGAFDRAGHVPLPPYIHAYKGDPERYQTVFNKTLGSAAAPTAGLHFTPALLKKLKQKGVRLAKIDLHVGLDTFAPVTEEDPETHHIHKEWCAISAETAQMINQAKQNGGRVVAVGTTTVRTLESAAARSQNGSLQAGQGDTSLFILPGYRFRVVDAMVTNFHLPKSTLLMLVSAFAGRETMLNAYEVAKGEGYRFFSFGDAMLLL
jgi:S-adenosylmethionine:tRNA ribosyltransferase-isomerase